MGATVQDYTLHTLGVISAKVLLITTEKMQRYLNYYRVVLIKYYNGTRKSWEFE